MKRASKSRQALSNILTLLVFAAVVFAFVTGFIGAGEGQDREARRIARESIVRAAVSCYSIEGVYPDSFEYIKQNYNVQIDEQKYAVFYEIFASNIMPDISVIEK